MSAHNNTSWHNWLAVSVLGVASFTVVATELAPIGMLSSIAHDMGRNTGTTGLVVTLYAWLGAIAALMSIMTISHLPRKPLLIGLMLLLGVCNGISAISHSFEMLLTARLIGAIAHGAFWAMIGTMGAQLVSTNNIGRATAIIFGGVSMASVFGVPLINWISSHSSWRLSFSFLAIISIVTAITLALSLPQVSGTTRLGINQFYSVLKNTRLRKVYLIAACAIVAHFAAFTYIEVLLSSASALPSSWIVICLFTFGIAGICGNFVCGIFIDSHLKKVLSLGLMLIALCLGLMNAAIDTNLAIILLLVSGWGFGVAILFVAVQAWILRLAGSDALPASAIYASIFNGAVGFGAILGAGLLNTWGIKTLYLTAAFVTLFSLALVLIAKNSSTKYVVTE